MRLKTYTAATTAEAMERVRQELGNDAIIVSSQQGDEGEGARIIAALEERPDDVDTLIDAFEEETTPDISGTIRHALGYHGTPPRLADRLAQSAETINSEDAALALAGALDSLFSFAPLAEGASKTPLMLVGPPGAGKTVTTAKLAARAAMAGRTVAVITTDTQRAGGIEQLDAFTRILEIDLKTAESPDGLRAILDDTTAADCILIDTPGTNPFSDTELHALSDFVRAAAADPVLVLPAGGDASEASEIAQSFASIGATRVLATRIDMSRRLGGILAAADAARLQFCDVSVTPHVANGLSTINPVSFSRLLLPGDPEILYQSASFKASP